MALPFLFWLAYHGCALTLAMWAMGSAIFAKETHGGSHRAWTLVAGLLLPVTLALAALATPLGHPEFHLSAALVPVLALAAAWSNTLTISRAGIGMKLAHVPITLWNGALIAIYVVRGMQQIGGQDCGEIGTALVGGHAMLQTMIGGSDALTLPIFLHLPLCLPLMTVVSWPHRMAIGAAAITATTCLALLATLMPFAWDRAVHFRREPDPGATLAAAQQLGVSVAWTDSIRSEADLAEQRGLWLGLGAGVVSFDVELALFSDAERLQQVVDEIAFVRDQTRTTIAIARPPQEYSHRPAASLAAFADEMAKLHWMIAERLAPDWVVLYDGPFADLVELRTELGTAEDWVAICARGADDVQRANPNCKSMVVIETRGALGTQLFHQLARKSSTLAAVGIALRAEGLQFDQVQAALDTYDDWLQGARDGKPVWLLGVGACPPTSGGELGQWYFLQRTTEFAARNPRITGIVVDTLQDGATARGLVTVDGRTRLAYRRLRTLAVGLAEPPK